MFRIMQHVLGIVIFAVLLSGCQARQALAPVHAAQAPGAVARLIDAKGNTVGEATFRQTAQGVSIALQASGLRPGLHAIHIHEKAQCVRPDFQSAGGHFNPGGHEHGYDNKAGSHAGDLPNIEVKQDGTVRTEILASQVTLEPGVKNSLFQPGGTALVIHDKPDDYYTNPAGDAGARVACGAIARTGSSK